MLFLRSSPVGAKDPTESVAPTVLTLERTEIPGLAPGATYCRRSAASIGCASRVILDSIRRRSSVWPGPVLHFRQIIAMLAHVLFVLYQRVPQELLEVGTDALQPWDAIHHIAREMVAVKVIQHRHVKWGRGSALFLVAADV